MTTITTTQPPTAPAGITAHLPDVGIYVACLAAYNNGRLHGAWVDLEEATTAEEIQVAINWVLATSPEPGAEEYAIHDSTGLPAFLARTEWPELADLASYAEALAQFDSDDEAEAFRPYCDDIGGIADLDDFHDAYAGRWDSGADYAQQLAEDTGTLPDGAAWPLTCIDWEAAWRELSFDGYSTEPASAGGVHVFRPV